MVARRCASRVLACAAAPWGPCPVPRRARLCCRWAGPGCGKPRLFRSVGPGAALWAACAAPVRCAPAVWVVLPPLGFPSPGPAARSGAASGGRGLGPAAALSALLGFRFAAPRRAAPVVVGGFSPASLPSLRPPLGACGRREASGLGASPRPLRASPACLGGWSVRDPSRVPAASDCATLRAGGAWWTGDGP